MAPKYLYPRLPLQDPPKFTRIWIFGLKIYHLATLILRMSMKGLSFPKKIYYVDSNMYISYYWTNLDFYLHPGWLDWVNFCIKGECLCTCGSFYYRSSPNLCVNFFIAVKVMYWFRQNTSWATFWATFLYESGHPACNSLVWTLGEKRGFLKKMIFRDF
jgi:hypothetical protein